MAFVPSKRARIYLRDSAVFEEHPVHALIVSAFREAGVEDVSAHHGIMGFDPASGLLSSRPLRFHADLPVVVEAVGEEDRVQAALSRVRELLTRGLITLTDVEVYVSE